MSKMIDDLLAQGIRLKGYNAGPHKSTCPRCSHNRKDKRDECLWVNIKEDGCALWKCHNCFWTGAAGNVTAGAADRQPQKREYAKPAEPQGQFGPLPAAAVSFMEGRGITREVWERNQVCWDNQGKAICFPYFKDGVLFNRKYRTLDKRFRLEPGAQLGLYGLDDVKNAEEIIIVEGEFDKLALEVAGFRNVVSVPNGAPAKTNREAPADSSGAFQYLHGAEELLKGAKKIILAVDDDKPGENLRWELVRRFGALKCWVVKFPHKDANGCLEALGEDAVSAAVAAAKPYPIAGLYEVSDFEHTLTEYFNGGMAGGVPTGWENLNRLYTVMPGELTTVTGVPNTGKSEFVDALLVNLARNEGWAHAVFSPENGKEQHVTKLVEKVIGLPSDPRNPNRMALADFQNGAAWVGEKFYFIVADDGDNLPTIDWILEKASIAVFRYGIQGLVIDPYNEIEHKRPAGQNETEYVSEMLSKIKRFARNHGVHVWLIAHPTKMESDKDDKVKIPSLYNIAGSANFVNKTDNGIVIHRSEDAADTTEVHVKKIRFKHVGRRGKCSLRYEKETGRYDIATADMDMPSIADSESEEVYIF